MATATLRIARLTLERDEAIARAAHLAELLDMRNSADAAERVRVADLNSIDWGSEKVREQTENELIRLRIINRTPPEVTAQRRAVLDAEVIAYQYAHRRPAAMTNTPAPAHAPARVGEAA